MEVELTKEKALMAAAGCARSAACYMDKDKAKAEEYIELAVYILNEVANED